MYTIIKVKIFLRHYKERRLVLYFCATCNTSTCTYGNTYLGFSKVCYGVNAEGVYISRILSLNLNYKYYHYAVQ